MKSFWHVEQDTNCLKAVVPLIHYIIHNRSSQRMSLVLVRMSESDQYQVSADSPSSDRVHINRMIPEIKCRTAIGYVIAHDRRSCLRVMRAFLHLQFKQKFLNESSVLFCFLNLARLSG